MLDKAAASLTDRLINRGIIKEQDYELYLFGIETVILKIVHLLSYLVLGFILGEFKELLIFLIIFIPLREYSGGFHAHSRFKCYIVSCLTMLSMLLLLKLLPESAYNVSLYVAAVSGTFLLFLVPVGTGTKSIDDSEKIYYKSKAGFIIVLLITLVLFLYMLNQTLYSFIIALGLLYELAAAVAGKYIPAINR